MQVHERNQYIPPLVDIIIFNQPLMNDTSTPDMPPEGEWGAKEIEMDLLMHENDDILLN